MKYKDGRTIAEIYSDTVEIWSNYAAIGYTRIALERAGVDQETADKVIQEMRRAFDDYSIDEAEQRY